MAEPRNDPPQDNRTDLQREIDRQQIYDEATKEWDAQQKAMTDFENNLLFGLALKGLAPKIPFVSESQRAYEYMQRRFEMRQQQQQLEKQDQGRQGSPIRLPELERNSRYGNKAPLPTRAATATAPLSSPPPSPSVSDVPHWLDPLASPPRPLPASDTPSWLDPGPVGKALRRVLGFPE